MSARGELINNLRQLMNRTDAEELVNDLLHEEAEKIRSQTGKLDDLSGPDAVVFFLAVLVDPYTRTKWVDLNAE